MRSRCSAPCCWCAHPPTICVFSTGERWTFEELRAEGRVRVFLHVRVVEPAP